MKLINCLIACAVVAGGCVGADGIVDIDLTTEHTAHISGTVLSSVDGVPISGARIGFYIGGGGSILKTVYSDNNGRYSLTRGCETNLFGGHELGVTANGFQGSWQTVSCTDSEQVVNVSLTPLPS